MKEHPFLFEPGTWVGEGKISLSMVEEELVFATKWIVEPKDHTGKVQCAQEIQIQGLSENMRNELHFYDFHPTGFDVDMENQNVGRVGGKGVVDEKVIAWEFRNNEMNFEGFETYEKQSDGSYVMRGEYITSDQFRTQIQAVLYPHAPSPEEGEL